MLKLRPITLILCCALLVLALAGCGAKANEPSTAAPAETDPIISTIPLTEEEVGILEAMGSDVNVVADADYANIVTTLQDHPDSYEGQVYQVEGVYSTETINGVQTPFVSRTLVHEGEETKCGMPLMYLSKEIPDGAWTRVSAIIGTGDFEGETQAVLEVVAIETLAQAGQSQMEWDGVGHSHE